MARTFIPDTVPKIIREFVTKEIGNIQSLELGETSITAYRGDRGKTAYDHSQSAHARIGGSLVFVSVDPPTGQQVNDIWIQI